MKTLSKPFKTPINQLFNKLIKTTIINSLLLLLFVFPLSAARLLTVTGNTNLSATGQTISGHRGDSQGGAIYISAAGTLNITGNNITFDNNGGSGGSPSNTQAGGAIYIDGGRLNVNISGYMDFKNNKVAPQGASGGAMYFNGGTADIRSSRLLFEFNTAAGGSGNGAGGIYITGNTNVTIRSTNLTFNRNQGGTDSAVLAFNGGGVRTFTVTNEVQTFTINNNTAQFGAAIYSNGGSGNMYFEAKQILFQDNYVYNQIGAREAAGGVIQIAGSGQFNIYFNNNTVSYLRNSANDNNTSFEGGLGGVIAIYAANNKIYYDNVVLNFNNNYATRRGGVIWARSNTLIDFRNFTFRAEGNKAEYGGIISLQGSAVLNFTNGSIEFINNSSTHQQSIGTISIEDSASISFTNMTSMKGQGNQAGSGGFLYLPAITFNFSGQLMEMVGNTAFSTTNGYGHGGAFYFVGSNVTFSGTTIVFRNNRAQSAGGAMFIGLGGRATYSASSMTFEGNSAVVGDGGAISFDGGIGNFNVSGSITFRDNKALNSRGGAIYLAATTSATFRANQEMRFIGNSAGGDGGAIYFYNARAFFPASKSLEFTNNQSVSGNGGGMFFSSMLEAIVFRPTYLNFQGNRAGGGGGAMAFSNSIITFMTSSAIFQGNSASGNGGAMNFGSGTSVTFASDYAMRFIQNSAGGSGGGMYFNSMPAYFKNIKVLEYRGNIVGGTSNGGGMYFQNMSNAITFTPSSMSFERNTAGRSGGGMFFTGTTVSFVSAVGENSSMTFSSNVAGGEGGAMYFSNSSVTFAMNQEMVFKNNWSLNNGGAMNFLNSEALFDHTKRMIFENNKSTSGNGGGMSFAEAKRAIRFYPEKLVFILNTAGKAGGGMSFSNSKGVEFITSSLTFVNNLAISSGGGMYFIGTTVSFVSPAGEKSSMTFRGNTAQNHSGGAMYFENSSVTFAMNQEMVFRDNRAGNSGGGMNFIRSEALFEETIKMIFTNNKAIAGDGGAMSFNDIRQSIKFLPNILTFSSNTAGRSGGGMYFEMAKGVEFKSSSLTFARNTAISSGGAMYFKQTTVNFAAEAGELSYMTFSSNTARDRSGGAMYFEDSSVTFAMNQEMIFRRNTAGTSGGGMYFRRSRALFAQTLNMVFERNTAIGGDGGGMYFEEIAATVRFLPEILNFNLNTAQGGGGGMYFKNVRAEYESSSITFSRNTSIGNGGGIYFSGSTVIFRSITAGSMTFINNVSSGGVGGGLFFSMGSSVTFGMSEEMIFRENIAQSSGGAMYFRESRVIFGQTKEMIFERNTSQKGRGGAIAFGNMLREGVEFNPINLEFNNNRAWLDGGAMSFTGSTVIFKTTSVTFNENTAEIGGGGAMYFKDDASVTFASEYAMRFINNVAASSGGGMYFESIPAYFKNLKELEYVGNISSQGSGGGMYFRTMKDKIIFSPNKMIVESNISKNSGGGIYFYGTTISFESMSGQDSTMTFINNTAIEGRGGAMYIGKSSATFRFNQEMIFDYNYAGSSGGAIYFEDSAMAYFDKTKKIELIGNVAESGSGGGMGLEHTPIAIFKPSTMVIIYNWAGRNGGGLYFTGTGVRFEDTDFEYMEFTSNTAMIGSGGGIYLSQKSSATFGAGGTMTFKYNFAGSSGGAIYIEDSSAAYFKETKVLEIIGNIGESGGGGGLAFEETKEVRFKPEGLIVTSNIAGGSGGGMHFVGSDIEFYREDGGFSSITIRRNNAGINGGGLYFEKSTVIFRARDLTIFEENQGWSGGAIYMSSGTRAEFDSPLGELKFSSNIANSSGGAIYVSRSTLTLKIGTKLEIRGNEANFGGALYATDKASITFIGGNIIFDRNTSYIGDGIINWDRDSEMSFIEIDKLTATENEAESGGFVYVKGSEFKIEAQEIEIDRNIARGSGGGIGAEGATITIKADKIEFNENEAQKDGGGIYIKGGGKIEIEVGTITISTNTVMERGGGIYIDSKGELKINSKEIEIRGNESIESGGGIYVNGGTITISTITEKIIGIDNEGYRGGFMYIESSTTIFSKEIKINSNRAIEDGGGIYISSYGKITLDAEARPEIKTNTALYGSGGGIYINRGELIIDSEEIKYESNISQKDGGGIYTSSGLIKYRDGMKVEFITNISTGSGGGIYISSGLVIYGINSTGIYIRNTAQIDGGGVYIREKGIMTYANMTTITYAENTSMRDGGGLYIERSGEMKGLEGTTIIFSKNQSNRDGGGIYISSGYFLIGEKGTMTIETNRAERRGGGIYIGSGTMISAGREMIIRDNVSVSSGGGIYIENRTSITFKDERLIFERNTSEQGDGGIYSKGSKIIISSRVKEMTSKLNEGESGGYAYIDSGSYMRVEAKEIDISTNKAFGNILGIGAGGGIAINRSSMEYERADNIEMKWNTATSSGGAIYIERGTMTIRNNGAVEFSDNKMGSIRNDLYVKGGVINIYTSQTVQTVKILSGIYGEDGSIKIWGRGENTISGYEYFTNMKGLWIEYSSITRIKESEWIWEENHIRGVSISSSELEIENSIMTYRNNETREEGGGGMKVVKSTVTIKDSIVGLENNKISNTVTGGGGGIRVSSSIIKIESSSMSLIGNETGIEGIGGGMYIGYSTMSIDRSTIEYERNIGARGGGLGIYAIKSSITINESRAIFGNHLSQSQGGGGINAQETRIKFNNSDTKFIKNTIRDGGGIYANKSSIVFSGGKVIFSSNTAMGQGGAIYMRGSGIEFKVEELIFEYNGSAGGYGIIYADDASVVRGDKEQLKRLIARNNWALSGGFLYLYGENSYFDFRAIEEVTIVSNTAVATDGSGVGGGIYLNHSNINIRGNNIKMIYNTAASSGGAIYAKNGSHIEIIADDGDIIFRGNSANGTKNDIHIEGMNTRLDMNTENNNAIRMEDGIRGYNHSYIIKEGEGLLYLGGKNIFEGILFFSIEEGSEIIVEEATWTYNKNYLGLQLNRTNITYINSEAEFISNIYSINNMEGGAISGVNNSNIRIINSTVTISKNSSQKIGGGIYLNGSEMTLKDSVITISSNVSLSSGGAIAMINSRIEIDGAMKSISISSNTATENGGAIYIIDNSRIDFRGIEELRVIGNKSIKGNGAIYWDNSSEIIFAGIEIIEARGNEARKGGFLYLEGRDIELEDVKIEMTSNVATNGDGGGIYLGVGSEFKIERGTIVINGNKSQNAGGGIYANQSNIILKDADIKFIGNTSNIGAAFYIENGGYMRLENIKGLEISSNISINGDGVVYWDSSSIMELEYIEKLTAIGNKAQNGGFIYLDGQDLILNGTETEIIRNSARAGNGGGINISNGNIEIINAPRVKISSNVAQNLGGGIYQRGSDVRIEGGEIEIVGNTASSGAAIYAIDNSQIEFINNTRLEISGNVSNNGNGSIYRDESSNIEFNDIGELIAEQNKALSGGFLYSGGGLLRLSGINIGNMRMELNTATNGNGGAISIEGGEMIIEDIEIRGRLNKAIGSGEKGKGGMIYGKGTTITFIANAADIIMSSNSMGGGIGNDIYIEESSLEMSVHTQIRYESGIESRGGSNIRKIGDGLLYFSGRNYIEGTKGIEIMEGETEIEDSKWSYINNSSPIQAYANIRIKESSGEFNNNKNITGNGGAIYINGGVIRLERSSISFIGNTSREGSAIYGENGSEIRIEDMKAMIAKGNESISGDGIIRIADSDKMYITRISTIIAEGNKGKNGGFLRINNNNVEITDEIKYMNISSNTAVSGNGGGLNITNSVIEIGQSTIIFRGNKAQGLGGGIYVSNNGEIRLGTNNGLIIFEGNRAQKGSDIYADSGIVDIKAIGRFGRGILGGGIEAVNGSEIKFSGNMQIKGESNIRSSKMQIMDSTMTIEGIFRYESGLKEIEIVGGSVTMIGGIARGINISTNTNIGNLGGGIRAQGTILTIEDGYIANNRGLQGGGIYIQGGKLIIKSQKGDFIFENNNVGTNANDIRGDGAELIFDAYGREARVEMFGSSLNEMYEMPISRASGNEYTRIILNGGINGTVAGTTITKEGNGELILRGTNEISRQANINKGIMSLDSDILKVGSMRIRNGGVYNTYRGKTDGINGNITVINGELRIESSTISIGIYFNSEGTEIVKADKIVAQNVRTIGQSILKVTAYGMIGENVSELNEVKIMTWTYTSNIDFGEDGYGYWYDNSGLIGNIEYKLDYRKTDKELWLVIVSTRLEKKIDSAGFSYNEKEIKRMLDGINDLDSEVTTKIKIPLSDIENHREIKKILGQLSGEFIANVLKMGALMENSVDITNKFYRELGEVDRGALWGHASITGINRKDDGSDREFVANVIGGEGGINIKRRADEIFGIYGSYKNGELKQDGDEGQMQDIRGGVYWGSFNKWTAMKWGLSLGMQKYEVKRSIKIGESQYNPESKFGTYSIGGSGEIEIDIDILGSDSRFKINPIMAGQGVYVINDKIEESGGEYMDMIIGKGEYSRLNFSGGIRFRGEVGKVMRWNTDIYAGYIAMGGDEYTYKMTLKAAGEQGDMRIRANQESNVYAGIALGAETQIVSNLYIYISGDLRIDPSSEEKISGYKANIGLKGKFGNKPVRKEIEKKEEVKEEIVEEEEEEVEEDDNLIEQIKYADIKRRIIETEQYKARKAKESQKTEAQKNEDMYKQLDGLNEEELLLLLATLEGSTNIESQTNVVEMPEARNQTNMGEISMGDERMSQGSSLIQEESKIIEESQIIEEAQSRRNNQIKAFRLSAATFETGKTTLSRSSIEDIKKIAQELKKYEYKQVTVEGHTDSVGKTETNRQISEARARAVYVELIKNGIEQEKVKYIGAGSLMPITSNNTQIGRRQNRRVEIFVE